MESVARLSSAERRELFAETAARKGMTPAIVEKDFWVCWTLGRLFAHPDLSRLLMFKGGTSLSKVFNLIERFSEDIDLIPDWRVVVGEDDPLAERSATKQEALNRTIDAKANRCLADAMVEMKLIDTIGSGIRRMFMLQRNRFFPLPDYLIDRERSRVEAHIAGRLIDERYTFALIRHADLTLHEVILLDRVQKRLDIAPDEVKMLRGKNLIEGRAPNFFVAADVAAAVGDAAQYTRNKGLDKAFYKGLVISHLKSFGPTRRKDFEQLLLPKLPEVLDESQKVNQVRNLLQEMAKENAIVSSGHGVGAIWALLPTSE